MRTGFPIIYTSADSVFQIAAHEEIIPLPRLYELCAIAREQVCVGPHAVGRVIARPFIGSPGSFTRTANRHDYSLEPALPTLLDILKAAGHSVIGVGKIADIFAQRGICQSYSTKSNDHGMAVLLSLVAQPDVQGFIMANLVEFDSSFGHRRDTPGYARALERFDAQLALLLPALGEQDLLLLTADHGCDPTAAGTDHTREYVPLLVFSPSPLFAAGTALGLRTTFADVSATVADNFGVIPLAYGQSFLADITQRQ